MRKLFKILAYTLLSLIVVVVLAVGTVLYVVFTPERLTPVVHNVAGSYLGCDYRLGRVELTLFSTFPEFGLKVNDIVLVNPMEGAQSDTLLASDELVARIHLMALLEQGCVDVKQVHLTNARANVFIAEDGRTNYDVFITSPDTTEEDTTASFIRSIRLEDMNIRLTAPVITLVDERDSIATAIHAFDMAFTAKEDGDSIRGNWSVDLPELSLRYKDIDYACRSHIMLSLPYAMRLSMSDLTTIDSLALRLQEAELSLNDLHLALNGTAEVFPSLRADMHIGMAPIALDSLMTYVPKELFALPEDFHLNPVLDGAITVHADMREPAKIDVDIHRLVADLGWPRLALDGKVTDVLGDMYLRLHATGQADAATFSDYIPDEYPVEGVFKDIDLRAEIRLDDLMEMRLNKGTFAGSMKTEDILLLTDSMEVYSPNMALSIAYPTRHRSHKDNDLITCNIEADSVSVWMEQSDTLGRTFPLTANLSQARVGIMAEYNPQAAKEHVPLTSCSIAMHSLDARYDTLYIHACAPRGSASVRAGRRTKTQPTIHLNLNFEDMEARMGAWAHVSSGPLALKASATHTDNKQNILLEWRPRLDVNLHDLLADISDLPEPVYVPDMVFSFSNRKCEIDSARVVWGHSDFSLSGEVNDIGKWLSHKGIMTGELDFRSSYTDVDELLAFTSGLGGGEQGYEAQAEQVAAPDTTSSEPYMVPLGVDIVLNTHIAEARGFDQTMRNLGGRIYVRDGVLIMEEVGFVCQAAKLQLTGIYKTPRRNHIYLGLDYHMTDIDVAELVNMIPQVDTLLPMLRSFKGAAQFHLAAETYLNSRYELKTSTTRGACFITGQDLTLMDGETFTKIARILTFKKSTQNKIDSISAEITLFRDEVDIYPFLIVMDKWRAAVGGQHNLDGHFAYHVSLLKPLRLGVDVGGTLDDLNIAPAKCRYAEDFTPVRTNKVETSSQDIRQLVRDALTKKLE